MLYDELGEIIQTLRKFGAEIAHIEVKRAERALPERLWQTLSAFANSPGGGLLILGLDERQNFRTVGVQDPGKLQADLASLCDQMEPPLRPLIEIHNFEGKVILTAEIPEVPNTQKPCYYKGAGLFNGSFLRVADGDRRLTPYEIQLFLDGRGQPRYDLEPVAGKELSDFDQGLLKAFLDRLRAKSDAPYRGWDDQHLLKTFRVITEQNGRVVPTLAGYLCFAIYPQDEFPGLHLTVVRYPTPHAGRTGPQGERLVDNVKAEGNLVHMLQRGLEAILRNLQTRSVVKGLLREDVPEYPIEFLREVLVNAIAHRDYSPLARATPIQVRIFPDRLEVENPGGLFGPMTLERLGEPGLQATRNAFLIKILEDLPVPPTGRVVCENRGVGIITMLESLRQAALPPPGFYDLRTSFKVVVSNATLLDQETLKWLRRFKDIPLTDSQRLALAYIRKQQRLTYPEYRWLNPMLDIADIMHELADLTQKGLLVQHGGRPWTIYTLAESLTKPPPKKKQKPSVH